MADATQTSPEARVRRFEYSTLLKTGAAHEYSTTQQYIALLDTDHGRRALKQLVARETRVFPLDRRDCERDIEACLTRVLEERFLELNRDYLAAATEDAVVSLLSTRDTTTPPGIKTFDVPVMEQERAISMERLVTIPRGNTEVLAQCRSKASVSSGIRRSRWTLSGVPFYYGTLVLTPYLSELPVHDGKDVLPFDPATPQRHTLVIEKYLKGEKRLIAILEDDVADTDHMPDRLLFSHPYQPRLRKRAAIAESVTLSGYSIFDSGSLELFNVARKAITDDSPLLNPSEVAPVPLGSSGNAQALKKYYDWFRTQAATLDRAIAANLQ